MSDIAHVGILPSCDFDCDREARYDFKTKAGPWANGCSVHWQIHRAYKDLGTGKGQFLLLPGEKHSCR